MVDKVIRDGKVAVLYSPGFGAGWSTWADTDQRDIALFHPKLVEAAESGVEDIDATIKDLTGDDRDWETATFPSRIT